MNDPLHGKRQYLEAIMELADGEVQEALARFRRAVRHSQAPFDTLSVLAAGQCLEALGKVQAAARAFEEVAGDESAPASLRWFAWMQVAAKAQEKGDSDVLEKANRALAALGNPPFED